MARTRRLDNLRDDVYSLSDDEGAVDRHPAASVTRYLNQGGTLLWDTIVEARGREMCRKATPQTITTTASTTNYALNTDFYLLISVWHKDADGGSYPLEPLELGTEPELRETDSTTGRPYVYELRRDTIEILPAHDADLSIQVDYVPVWTDLVNDSDTANGVNGWEDFMVYYAVQQMAIRDERFQLASAMDGRMGEIQDRIRRLAPQRDRHRAKRVVDVRGPKAMLGGLIWRGVRG